MCYIFFFKQKTAYEMRISDWSSDVCSSDLLSLTRREQHGTAVVEAVFDDAFACPVVIGTITNHELDFVVRQQRIEIRPEIARHFAGCRRLDVEHTHYPRVDRADVDGTADRKSTTSELQSLMSISYAVFC